MTAIEHITRSELAEHLTLLDIEGRRWRFGAGVSNEVTTQYAMNIPLSDYILGIKESVSN